MTLDASGRLGIGTTNPQVKFVVSNGGTQNIEIDPTFIQSFNRTTPGYAELPFYASKFSFNVGNVGIGTTSPSQQISLGMQAIANTRTYTTDNQGTFSFYNLTTGLLEAYLDIAAVRSGNDATLGGSNIRFITQSTSSTISGTERMRITSGGNVLVGTTTDAGYKLQINGSSYIKAGNGNQLQLDNTGQQYTQLTFTNNASATKGALWFDNTNSLFELFANTGIGLTFLTSGSERMRITSGGELLINTTSDTGDYKLQVNGAIYSTNGALYSGGEYAFGGTGSGAISGLYSLGAGTPGMYFDHRATSNTGNFYWRNGTGGANTMMQLTNGGNLETSGSIKTAAPSGGTAKPWKLGEAGVTLGGSNTSGVRVEIDGVVYYLVTGYLP